MAVLAGPARAENRVALVVGNGAYEHVISLDNPVRDAKRIADVLAGQGFQVELLLDGYQGALVRAITDFGRSLRDAGPRSTGLFFYAGHGIQSYGTNFLLPVDARIADAADLSLVGVPAESVLRQMSSANNRTNIVILDACRNNPFSAVADMDDNGLAEMKAPTGTFLSYSTAPSTVALDGIGDSSPFTTALAELLPTPGVPIEKLFREVRIKVREDTEHFQTPWDTSSLITEFFFVPPPVVSEQDRAERELWASVRATRDPVQIIFFLRSYPESAFLGEAKALLAETMKEVVGPDPQTATSPSPVQSPEETVLIEAARASGDMADYSAYLQAFPNGAFAELALSELRALTLVIAPDPEAVAVAPAPPADVFSDFNFVTPFPIGEGIEGRSIAQILATGSPLFPPIEGIPEAMWKGQSCSNCHQWTDATLCDQAKTYMAADSEAALAKVHPLGRSFKLGLRAWATGGCE